MDPQSGQKLWEDSQYGINRGTMAADQNQLYIPHSGASGSAGVTSYSVDGNRQWRYSSQENIDQDILYTDRSVITSTHQGRIIALDKQTGELAWNFTVQPPSNWVTELAVKNHVYYGTSASKTDTQDSGFVGALDPKNQDRLWRRSFDNPIDSLIALNDQVIVASDDDIVCINAMTGETDWDVELTSNVAGSASVAAKSQNVIVSTSSKLCSISTDDGSENWSNSNLNNSKICISGNNIYMIQITGDGNSIAVHDLQSGGLQWSGNTGYSTSPIIAEGLLLSGNRHGEVTAWGSI